MNSRLKKLPEKTFQFLIIVAIGLGVFLRFSNLEKKSVWFDESYSLLRVSGYTESIFLEDISHKTLVEPSDLQKYQSPSLDKTLLDVPKSIAQEEPQLTPFYYMTLRLWMQVLGSSIVVSRTLSIVFSIGAMVLIYLLCKELFDSTAISLTAVALLATSPFHLLFAQEVRHYSLWSLTILLSNYLLLRSLRNHNSSSWVSWLAYSASLSLSLYTCLLSAFMIIGHGTYIVLCERFCLTKIAIKYLVSTFMAFLSFIPWIFVLFSGTEKIKQTVGLGIVSDVNKNLYYYVSQAINLNNIKVIFGSIRQVFFDLNTNNSGLNLFSNLSILFLISLAIYSLFHNTSKKIHFFVITSTFVPLIFLYVSLGVPDPEYMTPSFLGVELCIAYLLGTNTSRNNGKPFGRVKQQLWQIATILTLSFGVVSCIAISNSSTWWTKNNVNTVELSRIVNTSNANVLIISDASPGIILPLTHHLSTGNKLFIRPKCFSSCLSYVSAKISVFDEIGNSDRFRNNMFLLSPSDKLRSSFENKYYLKPVYIEGSPEDGNFQLFRLDTKSFSK